MIQKCLSVTSLCLLIMLDAISQNAGIGTNTPNASASLDIQSTSKGALIPRMTTAQRNVIVSPATGLLVFDSVTNSFWFKSNNNWIELVDTMNNAWKKSGNNIYSVATGNVGIGKNNPAYKLTIDGNLGLYNGNDFTGSMYNNASDFTINATSGNIILGTSPEDIVLQTASIPFTSGNVGIGTTSPVAKLDVSGSIQVSGELNNDITGTANLIPIAYGRINGSGSIAYGTGNFVSFHTSTPISKYTIRVPSLPANAEAIIVVTPIILTPPGGESFITTARANAGRKPALQNLKLCCMHLV